MENSHGMIWLMYALCTVGCFGVYGVFLHIGQQGMNDSEHSLFKSFFFVGIAYLLSAVIGSAILLKVTGGNFEFTGKGITFSLIAGLAGAGGAFFILMAFRAKAAPPEVMSIVFCGAPIVNAVASMILHPPKGGLGELRWQFVVGIILAAVAGFMVAFYKPKPGPGKPEPVVEQVRDGGIFEEPPAR